MPLLCYGDHQRWYSKKIENRVNLGAGVGFGSFNEDLQ